MKHPGKGILIKVEIGGAMVVLGQTISITLPTQKMENLETDDLDNTDTGIPYSGTGRTERGEIEAEIYFDPGLSSHVALLTWASQSPPEKKDVSVTYPTTTPIVHTWADCPGCEHQLGKVVLNDFVKGSVKFKASKLLTAS